MTDFSSPRVAVREVRKGPLVLTGKGETIGGFMGIASKGAINTPEKFSSFKDVENYHGSFRSDSQLMYAVKDFFTNGGKFAYVSRVGGSGSVTAAVSSANGTGAIIDWDASFPGIAANGWSITTTRKEVIVANIPAAASLGTGAITSLILTTVGRIRVGDLFRVRSTGGGDVDTLHATVTGVNTSTNTITFASATPTGAITVADPTDAVVEILLFDVSVRDENGVLLRTWKNLRMSALSENYFGTVISSTYRTPVVADLNAAGAAASDLRPTDGSVVLVSGVDPTVTDSSYIGGGAGSGTGLNAFDGITEMDMLSIPGVWGTGAAVAKGLLDHAELSKTYMAILSVPGSLVAATEISWVNTTLANYTRYAEGPWSPHQEILDPLTGSKILTDPCGARQGRIAATHKSKGIAKAAAGTDDGRVQGVVGLARKITRTEYDTLYPERINAIQVTTGAGICFMGNITLDPDESIIESSVAFYLLKKRKILEAGLQWVAFALNNAATRARVVRFISANLRQDWRNGLLDGDRESDAYFVECNEENNGPEVRAARRLNIRVGVNVTHTVEFGDVTLEQDTRALELSLATAGG